MTVNSSGKCPNCENKTKIHKYKSFFDRFNFEMPFCSKCEWIPSIDFENITAYSGKALRGVD